MNEFCSTCKIERPLPDAIHLMLQLLQVVQSQQHGVAGMILQCCRFACCSVAAKASAEAEAERLKADNTALEARLRTMVAREVRCTTSSLACCHCPCAAAVIDCLLAWPCTRLTKVALGARVRTMVAREVYGREVWVC
jgi:hypothetical protein